MTYLYQMISMYPLRNCPLEVIIFLNFNNRASSHLRTQMQAIELGSIHLQKFAKVEQSWYNILNSVDA